MPIFRRNVRLKLLSLVLAYVTWAVVIGRSPGVRFISAPVEFQPPDGNVVVDYNPREVRVRLQGDAPVLSRLSEQNVYARVQLEPSLRLNRPQRVSVQEREVLGVPPGVTKEIITPALTVTLERKVSKIVPVTVRFSGSPPPGYRVVQALPDPRNVEVSGPENALRGVDQVPTDPIDPKGHKRAFSAQPDLMRPDALLTVRPESVRVSVLIDEVPQPLRLTVPVRASDDAYVADPGLVDVELDGPPSLLARIRGDLSAVADATGLPARGGQAQVRLEFPGTSADESSRIHVTLIEPSRVRLIRKP